MSDHMPNWYPDPTGRYEFRYHNGVAWTADVASGGHRSVDPLGVSSEAMPRQRANHSDGPAVPGTRPGAPTGFGPPAGFGTAVPLTHGGHPGRPPQHRGGGLGVAAMVLGIVAVATAWMPFVFALSAVCAVLAAVFGIATKRRRRGKGASSQATVGLVLAPIALVVAIGGFALTTVVFDLVRPGPYHLSSTTCENVDGRQVFEGVIHNDSGRTRGYTIQVEFLRGGTRNVLDRATATVTDVPPGQSAPWSVNVLATASRIDCRVVRVGGRLGYFTTD
jgi:hypothetical protein